MKTNEKKMIVRVVSCILLADTWNEVKQEVDMYIQEMCNPFDDDTSTVVIEFKRIWSSEYRKDVTEVSLIYEEIETDIEFKSRIEKEEISLTKRKAATYESLHKEFGKND